MGPYSKFKPSSLQSVLFISDYSFCFNVYWTKHSYRHCCWLVWYNYINVTITFVVFFFFLLILFAKAYNLFMSFIGGLSYAWDINFVVSVILQVIVCLIYAGICLFGNEKWQMKVKLSTIKIMICYVKDKYQTMIVYFTLFSLVK